MAWVNDPPNPKIKDWNVTELKVSQNSAVIIWAYLVDRIRV